MTDEDEDGEPAVRLAMMVVVVFVITFAFAVTLVFCAVLGMRGGTAGAEIEVPSVGNPELSTPSPF